MSSVWIWIKGFFCRKNQLRNRRMTRLAFWNYAAIRPVLMYAGETWPVKAADAARLQSFEFRCWRWILLKKLPCPEETKGLSKKNWKIDFSPHKFFSNFRKKIFFSKTKNVHIFHLIRNSLKKIYWNRSSRSSTQSGRIFLGWRYIYTFSQNSPLHGTNKLTPLRSARFSTLRAWVKIGFCGAKLGFAYRRAFSPNSSIISSSPYGITDCINDFNCCYIAGVTCSLVLPCKWK